MYICGHYEDLNLKHQCQSYKPSLAPGTEVKMSQLTDDLPRVRVQFRQSVQEIDLVRVRAGLQEGGGLPDDRRVEAAATDQFGEVRSGNSGTFLVRKSP